MLTGKAADHKSQAQPHDNECHANQKRRNLITAHWNNHQAYIDTPRLAEVNVLMRALFRNHLQSGAVEKTAVTIFLQTGRQISGRSGSVGVSGRGYGNECGKNGRH
jgi:hypothetical protein